MLREVYHTVKITQKQVLSLSNKVAYGAHLSCRLYSPMAVKGLKRCCSCKKVQVGKEQEKAQSEKDSHSKNRDGKKLN